MMILVILGVLVFLLHAGICGYIIGLIADAMRHENMGSRSTVAAVFINTSLLLSVVLDMIGIYTLITL